MEQDADQTSAAEQRAFAVAKLKRAASLPRMKDGRRPPMHADGVSDGERVPGEEKKEEEVAPVSEEKIDTPLEVTARTTTPDPPPRTKRRPRSRSRSRGSRDFKGKARATQSPTPRPTESPAPSPLIHVGDSSPEESPPPPPSTNIQPSTPVISPIPSHFAQLQASHLLVTPVYPDSPLYYPGTSPPTPMLPSLEALQKGLFRSNSASARMIALHKLTGGADTYDSSFPSPSPTPPPPSLKLGRNNTLGGGERSAARQAMLRRLAERTKDGDGDVTSGDEKTSAPPPSFPSSLRNTPAVPSTPQPQLVDIAEHLPSRPTTPSPPAVVRQPTPEQIAEAPPEGPLVSLTPEPSAEYERPRRRRSLIVEVEDPPSYSGLPATPTKMDSGRAAFASVVTSIASTDSLRGSGVGVPVFMAPTDRMQSMQDMFPMTPQKDKPFHEEEEERILYQLDSRMQDRDFHDRMQYRDFHNRQISWIADPGEPCPRFSFAQALMPCSS
jgi:serine/arginine repetitive matrix protein 2